MITQTSVPSHNIDSAKYIITCAAFGRVIMYFTLRCEFVHWSRSLYSHDIVHHRKYENIAKQDTTFKKWLTHRAFIYSDIKFAI